MRTGLKALLLAILTAGIFWTGSVISDRQTLGEELIRLHVVANSDSEEDQAVKLQVKDAIVESLQEEMQNLKDPEQAKVYLQDNLPKIEAIANQVLVSAGFEPTAVATIAEEAFDIRYYDTFALPAGVYEALRVTIGNGEGKNWWCVVFPTLCIPATATEFESVAAGSGFHEGLIHTLEGVPEYELRFYFLELLGRMENIFFTGGI